jgi:hypothetical protein
MVAASPHHRPNTKSAAVPSTEKTIQKTFFSMPYILVLGPPPGFSFLSQTYTKVQ